MHPLVVLGRLDRLTLVVQPRLARLAAVGPAVATADGAVAVPAQRPGIDMLKVVDAHLRPLLALRRRAFTNSRPTFCRSSSVVFAQRAFASAEAIFLIASRSKLAQLSSDMPLMYARHVRTSREIVVWLVDTPRLYPSGRRTEGPGSSASRQRPPHFWTPLRVCGTPLAGRFGYRVVAWWDVAQRFLSRVGSGEFLACG